MGVIKQFAYGRTPPIFRGSDESLNSIGPPSIPLTPPSEDELQTPTQAVSLCPQRRDPALLIQRLEQVGLTRKRVGARKARRENNARALQTLAENDNEAIYATPTIEDFIPNTETPLTKVVTDFTSMMIWQYFIAQTEEEQEKFLEDISRKRGIKELPRDKGIAFTEDDNDPRTNTRGQKKMTPAPTISPQQRFGRLDGGLKSVLKRRNLPLGILSNLEEDVIEVFLKDDSAIYISQELDSYRRLLLHGISRYHFLNSWSVNLCGTRRTKMKNNHTGFSRPEVTLAEFLEKRLRVLTPC